MNRNSKRKIIAYFMAIVMLLVCLASITYIAEHTGHTHHCHEEDCPICKMVSFCRDTLRNIGSIGLAYLALIMIIGHTKERICLYILNEDNTSLVSLKVRLND